MTVDKKMIDFGYEQVPVAQKQQRVRRVFDSVAANYDIMNDAMSAGMHRLWKRRFIRAVPVHDHINVLDLASGTGDIAFLLQDRIQKHHYNGHITLSDINEAMLEEGRARAVNRNRSFLPSQTPQCTLSWQLANAESLPFGDHSMDVVTMAFGIRNVTHRSTALREIVRVLKPGGQFFCLEFSQLPNKTMQLLYDRYSFTVIPKLGQLLAGDRHSYQYLVESIRQFPTAEKFESEMMDAGFKHTSFQRLNHGIVAIHTGWAF